MRSAFKPLVSCLVLLVAVSACSKAKVDPCSLLPVGEARGFDSTIATTVAFPQKGGEKNDLCVYSDANDEQRLMVFVWSDPNIEPMDAVRTGMKGEDPAIIEITGVGEKAAAGFQSGELKLFAARNSRGMIGIRAGDPIAQSDAKFEDVQALVTKLLGRLE